jgi:hypothetical protein
MRRALIGVALGLVGLSLGCDRWTRPNDHNPMARTPAGTPKPEQLIAYMNANAQRIRSLECLNLDIDAKQEGQAVSLSGVMACQKTASSGLPPNFRMQAFLMGKTEVDLGSNSQEFWFWIARDPRPFVYHCSYADYRAGKAHMPFPFQPEWIVEALGIAECNPNQKYEVRESGNSYDLIERTTSPQGQPVQKVTVFNRAPVQQSRSPQIVARKLLDAQGKEICAAQISEVQVEPLSSAIVPRLVKLRWPEAKLEMVMKLRDLRVNSSIDEARAADLFTRRRLANMPGYDLARGPDTPTSNIKRTGGVFR